mmetsp:Transcript_23187/g.58094  ORF Transcript_23187/g.58094 Transcript_23187/m.58094 type:complete len:355 (+) Transcript_23187:310-1374(+)
MPHGGVPEQTDDGRAPHGELGGDRERVTVRHIAGERQPAQQVFAPHGGGEGVGFVGAPLAAPFASVSQVQRPSAKAGADAGASVKGQQRQLVAEPQQQGKRQPASTEGPAPRPVLDIRGVSLRAPHQAVLGAAHCGKHSPGAGPQVLPEVLQRQLGAPQHVHEDVGGDGGEVCRHPGRHCDGCRGRYRHEEQAQGPSADASQGGGQDRALCAHRKGPVCHLRGAVGRAVDSRSARRLGVAVAVAVAAAPPEPRGCEERGDGGDLLVGPRDGPEHGGGDGGPPLRHALRARAQPQARLHQAAADPQLQVCGDDADARVVPRGPHDDGGADQPAGLPAHQVRRQEAARARHGRRAH